MAVNLDHQRDRISTASGDITINTAGSLRIPVGTTAQRPQSGSVATGQIRFNTQLNEFEGYNGTTWSSIGGVSDTDGDTYINAEQSSDDDTLRFYTAGSERITISSLGIVNVASSQQSTSITTGSIVTAGGMGISKDLFIGGNLDVTGNVTIGGTINLGDDDTDNININADLNSNLIPNVTDNFDIGSATKAWKDLYLTESINFKGATGENEIVVPTNLADALSLKDDGGNDILVIDTTTGDIKSTFSSNIVVNTTGSITIPVGNTAQRPTAQTGMLRFNSQTTKAEIYNGTGWADVGAVTEAFKTISVSGQNNIEADAAADTLTLVAGSNMTITTDQNADSITFASTQANTFGTIAVASQSNIVADSPTDTLTLVAGSNITITTDAGTDEITINSTASGSVTEAFKTIAVSGQSDVIADTATDTLTLVAGSGMTITTNPTGDEITFISSGGGGGGASDAFKTIAVAGQNDVVADSSTDTLTLVAGSNMTITTNAAGDTITFASSGGGGGGGGASVSYQNNAPTTGLSTGDLWFDTGTTGELYVYTGSEWISTTGGADAAFITANFTGNGSNKVFDTQAGQGTVSMVFLNGVLLQTANDYTESNGIVTFIDTPLNGDQIDIVITGEVNSLTLPSLGLANHNLIVVDSSGNVRVDSLKVSDLTNNRIVKVGSAGELEDDPNFTFDGTNMVVGTTGSIRVPVGTTAQRPSAITGQFRFNSTLTQFEGYDGSAWGKIGGGDLSIAGDSGTDSVELGVDTLTVNSGTGLTTTVTNNTITIVLDNTAVTPASYGSATAIPVITVDQQGRITAASTANISTDLAIAGDSGTDTVTLGTDTLTFAGGTGLTSTISNNNVSYALDNTAVSAGNYGSTTAIPVLTIDAQGRITSASTASLSVNKFATITVTDTASGTFAQTGSVSAASDSDTLTFVGGTNVDIDINTTSKTIKIDAVTSSAFTLHSFTGDNTTTAFSTNNTAIDDVQIFINGVLLASGDYSINTGTGVVTFGVAPLLNDEIKIYAFTTDVSVFSLNALGLANHDKITVDSSGNLTLQGTIAMATNKITGLGNPTSAQDAATKTYVDTQIASQITLEDLDIAGDSGSGAVDLDSQSLTIAGTTNEIQTSASGQTITIGLPNDVTIGNDLTVSNDASITGALTVDTTTLVVDKANNRVGIGVATPLEKLHVDGAIRIDGVSNLETATATLATTTQSVIDTFAATKYRSCKYTVQATNTVTSEYQIIEILLIHDGSTAYVSAYGLVYTGSAELVAFDADINSGNVRLLATAASSNQTVYKITRISTLV